MALRGPPLPPSQALPVLLDIQQNAEAGDAASKVTFFNAVSWCLSERAARRDLEIAELRGAKVDPQRLSKAAEQMNACSAVSWELSSKRFSYIREVAALGDVEAQLAMVRAMFSLPREDPSWILAHTDELQKMKGEAVILLAQAANAGSREAMERLADIYRHGRFGEKDEALATMYETMARARPRGPN